MATRRSVGRLEAAIGVFVVLVIIVAYGMISGWDPVRVVRGAAARIGALSRPGPVWTSELGAPPEAAGVFDDVVVVFRRRGVEARSVDSGKRLWDRTVDWSALAGNVPVVITGRRDAGLEALDAITGQVRWREPKAIGAWTFSTDVLTLVCPDSKKCVVEARAARDGASRWRVTVPGLNRANAGANSTTVAARDASRTFSDAVAVMPAPAPELLGLPVDQRVEVVDTTSGRRLHSIERPGSSARVTIVGGQVLVTLASPKNGKCRFTLEARSATTGSLSWRREGYDPHTVSGAGCEQRRAPTGAGAVLAVTRDDGRDALLSLYTGQEIWVGSRGESVTAVTSDLAMVRAPDGKTVRAMDPASGTVRWERPLLPKAQPVVCGRMTLLADRSRGRIAGYDSRTGGQLLDLRTRAEVVGCSRSGLLLARGRTVGLVTPG